MHVNNALPIDRALLRYWGCALLTNVSCCHGLEEAVLPDKAEWSSANVVPSCTIFSGSCVTNDVTVVPSTVVTDREVDDGSAVVLDTL